MTLPSNRSRDKGEVQWADLIQGGTGGVAKEQPQFACWVNQVYQCQKKVENNEQRLRSGLAADGQPLTPTQVENLREIVRLQRERLESFAV